MKTKPYEHQLNALKAAGLRREFAYLMDMGTGKTKVVIDEANELFKDKRIDSLIVIAPKGVYHNWEKEMEIHYDGIYRAYFWSPRPSNKEQSLQDNMLRPYYDGLKFVAMNLDAITTLKGNAFIQKFISGHKTMLVIDESTRIKNPKAQCTIATIQLGKYAVYRRILTGSPITNSPLDIYTQAQFLHPQLLGFGSYYAFRARYAILQNIVLGTFFDKRGVKKTKEFKKVVGFRRLDELTQRISKFSFRVRKDECLDLPDKVYETRDVELTPEQAKAYEEMKRHALIEINKNFASAQIALTQLLRLHQIVCGHIPMDNGGLVSLPSNRIATLMEIIEEVSGKVIIWANYIENVKAICAALKDKYSPFSYFEYHGAINQKDRQAAIDAFQTMPQVRFFVGTTQTGGMGITLTAANTVIYFSNNYKLEDRLQSEDRAHRIGQKNNVTYVDIVAPGTVDEKIIKALRNKLNIASVINRDTIKDWL